MACTTKSRSYIYDAMGRGEFPRQVKLGGRSVAWVESEVQDWIEARIAARDQGVA